MKVGLARRAVRPIATTMIVLALSFSLLPDAAWSQLSDYREAGTEHDFTFAEVQICLRVNTQN